MSDIIQLLPDAIANQIAAGEVIQRPASAVKELLENAVDAGASNIQLVLKDAGKTLIQVIDDGCGMSETDARMAFERHATSKIRETNDLFNIRTKGFRGEALASVAAVAQVELKTRRTEDELGTHITIEHSKVVSQEPCSTAPGTSISIKNLFFNVPARRKFLKSDPVETRHIVDELQRVAMAHPDIAFTMLHNGNQTFLLEAGSFRQRIVGIFGKAYNQRLVPVEEETSIVKINGFIGKPEFARKTRGEQFFFVNQRFIKNNYLHHAIQAACDELLPPKAHPAYFLNLTIDPATVDVNIHPTKTEVKFTEEKALYAILRSATRQALGKYNIAPSLDFEQETSFNVPPITKATEIKPPEIKVNPNFNPFDEEQTGGGGSRSAPPKPTARERHNLENWERAFEGLQTISAPEPVQHTLDIELPSSAAAETIPSQAGAPVETAPQASGIAFQLHGKYIVSSIRSGLLVIHQQRAHERILFERFVRAMEQQSGASQQQLFAKTIELPAQDAALVNELMQDLQGLGFAIRDFGQNTFILEGLPADCPEADPAELLESVLETFKHGSTEGNLTQRQRLAKSMAATAAVKAGRFLQPEEMNHLIDQLFACEMPYASPSGKPTVQTLTLPDLDAYFNS